MQYALSCPRAFYTNFFITLINTGYRNGKWLSREEQPIGGRMQDKCMDPLAKKFSDGFNKGGWFPMPMVYFNPTNHVESITKIRSEGTNSVKIFFVSPQSACWILPQCFKKLSHTPFWKILDPPLVFTCRFISKYLLYFNKNKEIVAIYAEIVSYVQVPVYFLNILRKKQF